jgi:hypothetical protein
MGSNAAVPEAPESALQQLCNQAKVSDEAKALLTEDSRTKEFIGLLVEKELFKDVIRLYAYLLPKREAIGWGCLCLRHVLASPEGKPLPAVQLAAERWVSAPNEENRWAAKQAADKAESKTPSVLLALGVFFAGPSLAAPNRRPVPPPAELTSGMVANAVILAGTDKEPKKAKEKYGVFTQKASALMARLQQSSQA